MVCQSACAESVLKCIYCQHGTFQAVLSEYYQINKKPCSFINGFTHLIQGRFELLNLETYFFLVDDTVTLTLEHQSCLNV